MEAAQKKDAGKASAFSDYDHSNFYYGAGDDPLNLLAPFSDWYAEALPNGYYLYSEPLQSAPGTRVLVRNRKTGEVKDLINLASYNYLGISYRQEVKDAMLRKSEASAAASARPEGARAAGEPVEPEHLDLLLGCRQPGGQPGRFLGLR